MFLYPASKPRVQHFFVDGAQHICQAWGACHPYRAAQPRE